MRGFKGSVYEGGHRVPLFIHWPDGGFGVPRDEDALSAHYDLMPTLLDLAGIEVEVEERTGWDGVSLVPLLRETAPLAPRKIVVTNQRVDQPRIGRPTVVMDKDWRFVSERDKGVEELYNLKEDPSQSQNVIDEFPEIAAVLRGDLEQWWQRVSLDVRDRARPVVGSDQENPSRLTANDWMEAESTDDIAWYPGFKTLFLEERTRGWVGNESNFRSLPWLLEAEKSGEYLVSLYFYDRPAQQPVNKKLAILEVDGKRYVTELQENAAGAEFRVNLEKGPLALKGWFADAEDDPSTSVPAFFAYVKSF